MVAERLQDIHFNRAQPCSTHPMAFRDPYHISARAPRDRRVGAALLHRHLRDPLFLDGTWNQTYPIANATRTTIEPAIIMYWHRRAEACRNRQPIRNKATATRRSAM
jgi:hypothetical protein